MASLAEQMVANLQELRALDQRFDTWLRELRLGAKVWTEETIKVRRLLLVTSESRPKQTTYTYEFSREFYAFLQEKRRANQAEIRRVEAELDTLTKPAES